MKSACGRRLTYVLKLLNRKSESSNNGSSNSALIGGREKLKWWNCFVGEVMV